MKYSSCDWSLSMIFHIIKGHSSGKCCSEAASSSYCSGHEMAMPASSRLISAMTKLRPKVPNPTDKHVGSRVRMRRMMLNMSQEKLGNALGLTFQQVQKYEKGTNRIGASRLLQISNILQVPVSFFFEGAQHLSRQLKANDAPSPTYVNDFLATSDGLNLTKAFTDIKDAKVRRRIVDLIEQIALTSNP